MNSDKNKTEEEICIEKGDALYKENLYKEAIEEYSNALRINPRNLRTQLKIAKAKLSNNNLKSDGLREKPPLALKPPRLDVESRCPGKNTDRLKYMVTFLIIIVLVVWYFIAAQRSRVDPAVQKSTAGVNFKISPEGADLIFGNKKDIGPGNATEPVKTSTGKTLMKRNREDTAKNETAKTAGTKKPATKERIAKEGKGADGKRETENGEKKGFWAAIKEYILSLFKGSGHQESDGKGIIRDPLGAENK